MSGKKKPAASLVRSSAAEYLTFVTASGTGGVEAIYADENVWLSQKMMAQLYNVDVRTINYHLRTIFTDSELWENAVIQHFRITATDGKSYDTKHYNLSAIIAVGYKVNSERAVQFRKWATRVVEELTIKGFAMDDERLKRGGSVLSICAESRKLDTPPQPGKIDAWMLPNRSRPLRPSHCRGRRSARGILTNTSVSSTSFIRRFAAPRSSRPEWLGTAPRMMLLSSPSLISASDTPVSRSDTPASVPSP